MVFKLNNKDIRTTVMGIVLIFQISEQYPWSLFCSIWLGKKVLLIILGMFNRGLSTKIYFAERLKLLLLVIDQ